MGRRPAYRRVRLLGLRDSFPVTVGVNLAVHIFLGVIDDLGDEGRFSRGGCAVQRSSPDGGLGSRVVYRRGLLGIEGFAVRVRFDPDRRTQRTVLTAVNRRGR
jgi:hypothetical protein